MVKLYTWSVKAEVEMPFYIDIGNVFRDVTLSHKLVPKDLYVNQIKGGEIFGQDIEGLLKFDIEIELDFTEEVSEDEVKEVAEEVLKDVEAWEFSGEKLDDRYDYIKPYSDIAVNVYEVRKVDEWEVEEEEGFRLWTG
jgi:hypothetical protein